MKRQAPAYIEIFNELYLKIINGEFQDGEQLPTEAVLCERYFVSRITIRRALNLLVEKGCLVRIAGKGSFINARPKAEEISNKTLIGVVICDISPSYGLELLKSIELNGTKNGCNIVLRNSGYDKQREENIIKEMVRRKDVKGLILQPVHDEYYNPEILNLSLKKYPVVLIDRNLEGVSLPFVGTDNSAITEKVVNYLFEKGHRNISFISSNPQNTTTIRDRLEALSSAYSKNNIANKYVNHFFNVQSTVLGASRENIRRDIDAIKAHLIAHPEITCIFAAEYSVCCLVTRVLNELNLKVPQDMSLVTFDNINDPFLMNNVSYIRQNEEEMGKRAVELLKKAMLGQGADTKVYISADFIEKDSVLNLTC